jgi:nitroreductase
MTELYEVLTLDKTAQDQLFRTARTANSFSAEPVTEEQLRAIFDLAQWGPSSMNSEPLRVVYLTSDEAKARLLPGMGEGNRAKTSTAPAVAILAYDTDFHEKLIKTFPHAPGAKDYFLDDAARAAAAKLNASLQVGYFILSVRAAGLAAGPMTGFDNAAVDAEFFAGTSVKSLVVVNIGHPGENPWFDRLPRLDYDEVVTHL